MQRAAFRGSCHNRNGRDMTNGLHETSVDQPPRDPAVLPDTTRAVVADGTMRAIVQDRYGTADVLQLQQIPRPVLADNEVLVRVHAAGLDRGTWHLMTGTPYLMRIIGFGFRGPKNRVPGIDVAGTVVAVGAAVTRFAVG